MRHLLCLAALLVVTVAFAQEPPNLLKNPGFEELTDKGFPLSWSGGEFGKPSQNTVADQRVAHSGKVSLRLGISPGSFVTTQAAPIPVKPNTTYYIAWWCKTDAFKRARAYLWLQTSQAQRVLENADQFGSQAWTLHLAQYTTTGQETTLAPVPTTHDSGGEICFAWFDDLGVYEGSFPPDLKREYEARRRQELGISQTAVVLSKSAGLTLWADNLAARIYADDGVPEWAKPTKALALSAARNEQVYAQVVVTPTKDLTDVSLAPGALKGPGTLVATAVQWWPVGYANIKTAHRQSTRLGLTPDPLLEPHPVAAPAGKNTAFLVGVKVPATAKPGQYTGSVALRSGGKTIGTVPLALQVYRFALPTDPVFRTLITFAPSEFRQWDKRSLDEIERDLCRLLHDHGIRGTGATVEYPAKLEDGKVVVDFSGVDARLEWMMKELHFNAFFLGPMFGGGTSEGWEKHRKWLGLDPLVGDFDRLFEDYLRQVAQHLRAKGWLSKAYLYLWDEPEPDYFDNVVKLQQIALRADPDFKTWETTSPGYEAFWGSVKAWSVPFSRPYFEENAVEARRQAGDEIWVYNIPASLECPPQVHRLWFWQAARYGAIGAQLWETTFYHGIDPWEDITPKPYATGRGGKQLYYYDAGQAILIYPNPSLRQTPPVPGKPLPCLRLKLLQKGIDDFGYLSLLQARLEKQARARKLKDPAAWAQTEMRKLAGQLVLDINRYNSDNAKLEQVRAEVAKRIEKLPE